RNDMKRTMGSVTRVGRATMATLVMGSLAALSAQRPQLAEGGRAFVKVDAPIVALTDARVIDGTGAAPKENQTLVLRDGSIAAVGDAAAVKLPDGATVVDLSGKSVLPGL